MKFCTTIAIVWTVAGPNSKHPTIYIRREMRIAMQSSRSTSCSEPAIRLRQSWSRIPEQQ